MTPEPTSAAPESPPLADDADAAAPTPSPQETPPAPETPEADAPATPPTAPAPASPPGGEASAGGEAPPAAAEEASAASSSSGGGRAERPRVRRESLFVLLSTEDGTPVFDDVTRRVGKTLTDYTRPRASCALRVTDATVAFSVKQIRKAEAQAFTQERLDLPRAPLAYLDRRAAGDDAPRQPGELVVDTDEAVHRLRLDVDDDGEARPEWQGEDDEPTVEQGRRALRLTLLMHSPVVNRPVAVGFLGFVDRPDTQVPVSRVAAKVLAWLTNLHEFRTVTGVQNVYVPPLAATAPRVVTPEVADVSIDMPVYLFQFDQATGQPEPVGDGKVKVTVSLSGRLDYHYEPSEAIASIFDAYRNVVDSTVQLYVRNGLGAEDLDQIMVDIAIGEVDAKVADRIREALEPLAQHGVDFTPDLFQLHENG